MESIGIPSRGRLLLLVVLLRMTYADVPAGEQPKTTESSAEIVPILLELPTTAAPKADPDGTSVNTLQYVAIVARHGDRYKDKDEFFENDPFMNEDPFWMPHGHGQLRNKGKYRMHYLGQSLRLRYNGFLKEEYYYGNIKFYSPDIDRCLMSAQLISQGLYPPSGVNIWNDNVGKFFQPIPIKSFDSSQDLIFNDGKSCPPYEKELNKVLSREMADINAKYKDIYEYVAYHTGRNITTLREVNEVYQTLRIEFENGRQMPEWTKQVFPSKLKALAGLYNQVIFYNDKMKRIKAGPIFTEIFNDLSSKTSHLVDRQMKMKIWTGYDSTLLKILHTLRYSEKFGASNLEAVMKECVDPVEAPKPPTNEDIMETNYGSALIVELHFINRKYFVKVCNWTKKKTLYNSKFVYQKHSIIRNFQFKLVDLCALPPLMFFS
ncbi:venom acid phosphatase Acph-1-like [Diaphorina citri]|uniref:acid phosphatase n=1 Tax=Diaphorina citri TaxID=121845 RepID=A0A1S3CWP5_DIACI|nr:venom acid phosphatase Acph-1-like [Diaphorina citri]